MLWSEASFNNDIGVPLTLLRLEKSHQAAVFEAGTNHPGELAPLVKMIRPEYGVITNIGREHLEFFGDVEGVAREEGSLAELLPADGRLFMNGDNEWTEKIAGRARAGVVRVGLGERNDWRAKGIRPDKNGVTFSVDAPKIEWNGEYRIHLLGRHQVTNALFAMAVSEELCLGPSAVRDGLAGCKPAKMRLQFWDAHSEAAHAEVGRRAAELGIGQLFAVGKMAPVTARAARGAGLNRVIEFADVETAMAAVKSFLKSGDVVLLKASRGVRLERITETLKAGKS
jgi:UDP-N-acetylmuramoyl-tripeptide--D-alanyl-D-alanine ligase